MHKNESYIKRVWIFALSSFVSGDESVARYCERSNGPSFTTKDGKFLEFEHLNKDFAHYSLLLRSLCSH
jgi:hypothetical protein